MGGGWGSAGQPVTVKYSCLTVGNQQCGDWEEVGIYAPR